jgi:hypothetical protein
MLFHVCEESGIERFEPRDIDGTSERVVWAIDADRLRNYLVPSDTFESRDSCAGYFVSRAPVVPLDVGVIDDCLSELIGRGVELRVMSNLWHLRDAVVSSTLQFSIIRMRDALPRPLPSSAPAKFRKAL